MYCYFSPIYDRLNVNNNHTQLPLLTFNNINQSGDNPGACGIDANVKIVPTSIVINEEIERATNAFHADSDNIIYVPIYFLVINVEKDLYGYELGFLHTSLFVYFNYNWHSIGMAICKNTRMANILTPDNIFKNVNENMKVLDMGVLTTNHLLGIQDFIKYTSDSHYNTKSFYYTLNLNKKFNNNSLIRDSETYDCSKFIYTIFSRSLTCSDHNNININKISRINKNYINCLEFKPTMTLSEFKTECHGTTSIFNNWLCMLSSGLANMSDILGGRVVRKKNKTKRKRRDKTKH